MATWFKAPAVGTSTESQLMSNYPIGIYLHGRPNRDNYVVMSMCVSYLHPCIDAVDLVASVCLVRTFGGNPTPALSTTVGGIKLTRTNAAVFNLCTVAALDRALAAMTQANLWVYVNITTFMPYQSISGLCSVLDKTRDSDLRRLQTAMTDQTVILRSQLALVAEQNAVAENARVLAEQALAGVLARSDPATAAASSATSASSADVVCVTPAARSVSPPAKRLKLSDMAAQLSAAQTTDDAAVIVPHLVKALTHFTQALETNGRCSVCLEAEADCVYMPCMHVCVCQACAPNVAAQCPLCRSPSTWKRILRN